MPVKNVMLVPSHAPQSEMFKAISDALSKEYADISVSVVEIHYGGIEAFVKEREPYVKILHFPYGYDFLYEKSRIAYYIKLKRKLNIAREEVNKLLKRELPDIIVLGHDTMVLHRIFIQEASKQGIPTLLVQEGVIGRPNYIKVSWTLSGRLVKSFKYIGKKGIGVFFPYAFEKKYGHGGCTKIAVWGEYLRKLLISEGVDSSKIVVTGSTRYDKIAFKLEVDREKIYQELNIPSNKGIILFVDERLIQNKILTRKEAYIYAKSIIEAATRIPGKHLVIKLRKEPRMEESLNLIKKILDEINVNNVTITHLYLYELLALADVVIIFSSTVGLEALIFDKPVISVNFTGEELYPYIKSGAALRCPSPSEILPTIKKALFDERIKEKFVKNREKIIYEHLYKLDGLASKRVADLIVKMVEESKGED